MSIRNGHRELRYMIPWVCRRIKPSDFIQGIDAIKRGDKVILICRVSERNQKYTGNLGDQERNLRRLVEERGAEVIAVLQYTGSGWNPCWLMEKVAEAESFGAKLFAESTSRFVRSHRYHSVKFPDAQPNGQELADLRHFTLGITLVTALDPDATPGVERAYQSARGRDAKGNGKGGRAKRKRSPRERAIEMLPLAKRLHEGEKSLGQIAELTGVPKSTIQGWRDKNFHVYGFSAALGEGEGQRAL